MPPITPETVKDLLPNIDCGLCGNPSCATFARRISAKLQQPEECIICPDDKLQEIRAHIKNGVNLGEPVQNERVIEMSPCAEYGKVTVEVQLKKPEGSPFDLFDPCQMCNAFHEMGMLDKVRCSLQMGYAIAELKGKRMHIFKRGKVVMRAADSRGDALDALQRISKALWPTVICTCGDLVVDCLGGSNCSAKKCAHCDDKSNCAALNGKNLEWGYDNGITKNVVPGTAITGGDGDTRDLFREEITAANVATIPLVRTITEQLLAPDDSRDAAVLEAANRELAEWVRNAETALKTRIIDEENERLVTLLAILGYLNSAMRVSDALYELSSTGKYVLSAEQRSHLASFPVALEAAGSSVAALDKDSLAVIHDEMSVRCAVLRDKIMENARASASDGSASSSNEVSSGDSPYGDPLPHIFKLYHVIECTGNMLNTL